MPKIVFFKNQEGLLRKAVLKEIKYDEYIVKIK